MIPMNKWNVYIVAMIGNESFDCMRCSPKIQNTGKCWMTCIVRMASMF